MKKLQRVSWLIVISLLSATQLAFAADPAHPDEPIVPPTEAISRLKQGNARYTSGKEQPPESSQERAFMATNSYENAGMIFLSMTAAQAGKRRAELTKASIHLPSLSVALIRVSRPKSFLTKVSAICSSCE